jgi:hypothetical protein
MFQLWSDPLFWEAAPGWEDDRELADTEVAAAMEDQSSLSIRRSELYNAWTTQLEAFVDAAPGMVKQITDYIHKKRRYRREQIVLPATQTRRTQVLLSNGVESHDTPDPIDAIRRDQGAVR